MGKRPVIIFSAAVCLWISAAAFGEEPAAVAEGGYARVNVNEDGAVEIFYTELDNSAGAPVSLVKAVQNSEGQWVKEIIVAAPDFVPSGKWEIAVLGNGSYLLGMSLPRAATKRGLTPTEMEWGRVKVPTFFHIKPLKISDEDRARLGVAKKNSIGPVDANPFFHSESDSALGSLLVDNGSDVIIVSEGFLGVARCGKFVTFDAPIAAAAGRGEIVRTGKELAIFRKTETDGKTNLQRITTVDGKQFSSPENVISGFDADEFSVSSSRDILSLVYLKKGVDGKSRIYRRISSDGGKTWSGEEEIYVSENSPESLDSAIGPDGAAHVAWVETISGKRIVKHKKLEGAGAK